ncbi:hypothetical protein OPQ81_005164 [Rhizoctonia solani]|nr:hypothetical protein OPQ81_005164 [Rhizoctonia solani]
MRAVLLGLLATASLTTTQSIQSVSPDPSDPSHPIPLPTRPLEWGDVNVIHTTDIHGWISGHEKNVHPEKSWSGNFGDFYSFVARMRAKAEEKGSDILLVDTGDRRIGHGLTDHILDPLKDVNGQNASTLYYAMGYDLVVPGNHDLQNANVIKWTKDKLVGLWDGRYLTSNINRTNKTDPANKKPLGARYRRWTTRKGRNMMAFGVVTSKTRLPKDAELEIIPINQMVEEKWVSRAGSSMCGRRPTDPGYAVPVQFKDAIKSHEAQSVDVFVLLGHVDPKMPSKENNTWHPVGIVTLIYEAIRQEHPLKPILIFAGHTHQRWCKTFQVGGYTRSMLLQSGRYFDTVGWMSVKLDNNTTPRNLKFSRRYLDNNIKTYTYHTGISDENKFRTGWGNSINTVIEDMERSAALRKVYGHLDSDYYLDREWWTEKEKDKHSLFSFYLDAVQNSLVNATKSPNWLFFSNWGILRGDIYRGAFTLGDLYAITPDASEKSPFLYTTVSRHIADQIVNMTRRVDKARGNLEKLPRPRPETLDTIKDDSQAHFSLPLNETAGTTYGWVTTDECGNDGDDVSHVKIPQVDFSKEKSGLPVYFWRKSYGSGLAAESQVHIIVTNYIGGRWVPKALEKLGVSQAQLQPYRRDVRQDNLLTTYIQDNFPSKSRSSGKSDE